MDWNSDGKKDLISGDATGQVWLFLNKGSQSTPKLDKGVQIEADAGLIVGVRPKYEKGKDGKYRRTPNTKDMMGIYSKLHFGDWDGDGIKDLLIGQDGPNGQDLVWYKNVGTKGTPIFSSPTIIKLPGPSMGRPSPYLVDLDGDGKQDLLCGTEASKVYYFRNKGTTGKPAWEKGRSLELKGDGFEQGYRCRIDVTDWNNDGRLDILVGNITRSSGGNIWLFLGKMK